MIDSDGLRNAPGDVFGRIYEYFLAEFSKQGAHDNGEFFTPPAVVQTIVNVIEPDHGIILDPACGSGGMFVQSSHFIEHEGQETMKRVTSTATRRTKRPPDWRRSISPFTAFKVPSGPATKRSPITKIRTNWLASAIS
jgi:hypothetical protein